MAITNRFLVPKQIGTNGLKKQYVEMNEETLREIVIEWTRGAGVRSLERGYCECCEVPSCAVGRMGGEM